MTPAIVAALGVSAAASLAYGLWLTHQAPGVLRSAVKTAPVALLAGGTLALRRGAAALANLDTKEAQT